MRDPKSLFLLLLSAFLYSCGSAPNAETPQLKAWVLMENISSEYEADLVENFIERTLSQEGIPQLSREYRPIELYGEQDTYMANPWRVLLEKKQGRLYVWKLDRNEVFSNANSWSSWTTVFSSYFQKSMEEAYEFAERTPNIDVKNEAILVTYISKHKEEKEAVYEAVGRAYVDYICDLADKIVTIKDWEYCDYATTKSCTGYYVTYEIEADFYVLVKYIEENEGTGFQVTRLYAGDSIIELEQAMEADLYY